MSKPLRYSLIGLAALIVIAIALPFFVPVGMFKGQIEHAVSKATGREFVINGDLSLKLLPRVVLEVEDATLSNVVGARHETFAEMKSASIGVNGRALLGRNVEITHFTLKEPVLHLEVAKNGSPNWVFEASAEEAEVEGAENDEVDESETINNVSLENVSIVGGTVTYDNLQDNSAYAFSDVNMGLSMASLDSPFDAEGSLTYNEENVKVDLHVDELRALSTPQKTPLSIAIDSAPIKFTMDGSYEGGTKNYMDGAAALSIPSLDRFNTWTGGLLSQDEVTGVVHLKGNLSGGNGRYRFRQAEIKFDDMNGTGDVLVDVTGSRPKISGEMVVDAIDLRPYMEDENEAQTPSSSTIAPWSAQVTSFESLSAANIDLKLSTKSIKVLNFDIGESALTIGVTNGVLSANLTKFNLYGGSATGKLTIDGPRSAPRISAQFDLVGVNAEPLVVAATSRKFVTGQGDFSFAVATRGTSQKDWMESLTGTGKLFLNNGEIVGVDLTRMVQIIGTLTGMEIGDKKEEDIEGETGENRSTEFVEMGGNFSINNGTLNSQDFRLLNEIISLSGIGDINIGSQSIDFNVDPGVNSEDGGTKVALKVHGPWNDIHYSPDLKRILENEIKDRLGIEEDSPAGALFDLLLNNKK